MAQLDYPLHFDERRRTAEADADEHVRDLIEQVLFTAPGERVNRPTFGSGVRQLLFAPNGDALAAAAEASVGAALQRWLGDLIQVESLEVEGEEAELRITIQYVVIRSRRRQVARFSRGGAL